MLWIVFAAMLTISCYPPCTNITISKNYSLVSKQVIDSKTKVMVVDLGNYSGLLTVTCYWDGSKTEYTFLFPNTSVVECRGEAEVVRGFKEIFTTMGLLNFWLPLLLVFCLVFVALDKFFGGQYKDLNVIVSFSIAVLFAVASNAVKFVTTYLPYLGAGIVILAGLALSISFVYPGGLSEIIKIKGVRAILIGFAVALFITGAFFMIDLFFNLGFLKAIIKGLEEGTADIYAAIIPIGIFLGTWAGVGYLVWKSEGGQG